MPHYNSPKRKRRNSDCCSGINVIKYIMQIYNFLLLLTGGAVLGVAIWTIIWKHQYVSLLSTATYAVGTYGLALAGALGIIASIMGCCGVWQEQKCVILCYTFILVLIFLLESIIGGLSYFYETQIEDELNMTLSETFEKNYGVDESRTKAIDLMHQNYECCGAQRFEEWLDSTWYQTQKGPIIRLVPDSCCITITEACGVRDHPSNIPYTGCIYKMSANLRHHLTILAAVGVGVCFVHIIGMILSCCLYVKLKDPDE